MLLYKEFFKKSQKEGLENTLRLFYGSYYGIVVDNNDPKQAGRVKVKVPQLTDDQVIEEWARPQSYAGSDSGLFAVPAIGSGVWVSFEFGNPRFPLYNGGWWAAPNDGGSEAPEEAKGSKYPKVTVFKTPQKHGLLFDGADDIVKLFNNTGGFIEIADDLVKLYGEAEPAVLGDKNGEVHAGHIDQLVNVIAEFNNLINQLNITFTAQGSTITALAPAAAAFTTASAAISTQLFAINTALTAIKNTEVPATKSGKVKLS